jgi:hypothetical protein
MRRLLLIPLVVFALLTPVSAAGSKGGAKTTHAKASKASSTKPKTSKASKPKRQSSTKPAVSVVRDENGRIQRSAAARHAFARHTGFPNGRPGYMIDHILPLACGWGGCAVQHAVADGRRGEVEGQVGACPLPITRFA